ncbi:MULTISPECIES: hypothetical protein [unclassified Campylobacter]|uniref:hypothetical protein n=1 Tax=unclassified Campylobacter TaxID=2593542 RepID=UPI003D33DAC2
MIALNKSRKQYIDEILSMQKACDDIENNLCELDLILQAYLQRKSEVCVKSRKKLAQVLEILKELKGVNDSKFG